MKNDALLEEIKARTDIVDFVSAYVPLKQAGQNWKGLCPFHAEKTPSFMVNPSKQIFHCFGCGSGGDVIAFLLKYENMSFPEAIRLLAERAGIPPDRFTAAGKMPQGEDRVRKALRDSASYFAARLRESATAAAYLASRGVSAEVAERFQLGYAPEGWRNLCTHLRGLGFTDPVIREAGLGVAGEKGLYDFFRGRLIFPIMGMNGPIAFGGRSLDGSQPKYLNSPETPVFRKSETLYGLLPAREAIRKEGFVIIVEGYMDVIACHGHGFGNAVAPLGTAVTAAQVGRLRKLVKTAVVVFDGDAAGIAAAKRSLPLFCRHDFTTRILVLPGGEDPDSYLAKEGAASFRALLTQAQSVVDFLLGTDRRSSADILREVLALVAEHRDPILADAMLMDIAGRTRISETVIREEYAGMRRENRTPAAARAGAVVVPKNQEEFLLLSAVIAHPEKAGPVFSRLDLNDLREKTVASLLARIAALGEGDDPASVLDGAGEAERRLFTRLSVDAGFDLAHSDRIIGDCLNRIEERKFSERLRDAERSGDVNLVHALLRELKKTEKGKVI